MTLEAFLVAAQSIVKGVLKEIKARNTGHHPVVFGELAYSANRLVLVLTKENINASGFLFNIYKLFH